MFGAIIIVMIVVHSGERQFVFVILFEGGGFFARFNDFVLALAACGAARTRRCGFARGGIRRGGAFSALAAGATATAAATALFGGAFNCAVCIGGVGIDDRRIVQFGIDLVANIEVQIVIQLARKWIRHRRGVRNGFWCTWSWPAIPVGSFRSRRAVATYAFRPRSALPLRPGNTVAFRSLRSRTAFPGWSIGAGPAIAGLVVTVPSASATAATAATAPLFAGLTPFTTARGSRIAGLIPFDDLFDVRNDRHFGQVGDVGEEFQVVGFQRRQGALATRRGQTA